MAPRPRFKPYFRPLRRGPDSVQLGLSPEAGGIILTGLEPAELAWLDRLDGSLSEAEVYAVAAACGVSRHRADRLLTLLREHHVLVTDPVDRVELGGLGASESDALVHDADVLALAHDTPGGPLARILERRRRHVVVAGAGRLPWSIASLLRSTGVGTVDLGDWAADAAEHEDLRGLESASRPDLVILVAQGVLDPRRAQPWQRRGVPLLPVVSDGRRVVVGPLVGRDPAQPCLRCVEMVRAERDAGWPAVMAQAASAGGAQVGSESTLVAIASGVAAMITHACLADDPVPAGVSVEVVMPWPRLDHRRWHRHPGCTEHQGQKLGTTPGVGTGVARVTMTG